MKKCVIIMLIGIALSLILTCANASIRDDVRLSECVVQINEKNQAVLFKGEDSVSFLTKIKTDDNQTMPTFRLPASLQIIEDEAFEGTAIVSIEFPETVDSIGEKAFANIPTLRSVKIPNNTKQIAKMAFASCNNVTITGASDSYARTWARENGIPFMPTNAIYPANASVQLSLREVNKRHQVDINIVWISDWTQKYSKWRPVNEVKTEQYNECIANHISGRAPPVCTRKISMTA